ncbi:MAG: hypothetical protein AAF387_13455, partial [Pseudomonadota bacterium]
LRPKTRYKAPVTLNVRRKMKTDGAAIVWDRACLADPTQLALPGDKALASMLLMHGLVMNGGLHHAVDFLSDAELDAAVSGFKYFGLNTVLDVIEKILSDPSLKQWNDANERIANKLYYAVSPDDELLVAAFDERYANSPQDFAPV